MCQLRLPADYKHPWRYGSVLPGHLLLTATTEEQGNFSPKKVSKKATATMLPWGKQFHKQNIN